MGKIYQVLVHGLRGERMTIDLCNTEEQMKAMTVLQLKEKVVDKLPGNENPETVRLVFTDKTMDAESTLSSYGIQHIFRGEANKYYGLINQGSTCYLNSVLQVLFMTEDFREAVDRHTRERPDSQCIDRQLKILFDDLKGDTAHTKPITDKLGIQRVCEQRDAAEYIENILNMTSHESSEIFHGQLTHRNVCSECGTDMMADGPFWSLPLPLTDSFNDAYSVEEGIREFFRDSEITGDNQMYCDMCDAKADATIKCEMKHHPEVLMLLLKRFEFDYRYMAYVKNNRNVDIPHILQIPENQRYKLYAVVDHSGDLRSGHYTATIQPPHDETWFSFNDAYVRPIGQPFQGRTTEKSHNAYLLFYKKLKLPEEINQESSPEAHRHNPSHNEEQCYAAIKQREIEECEEAGEEETDIVEKEEHDERMNVDVAEEKDVRTGEDEDVHGRGRFEVRQDIPNENLEDVNLETESEEQRMPEDVKEDKEQKREEDERIPNTETWKNPVEVQGEEEAEMRELPEKQKVDCGGQLRRYDECRRLEETQPGTKSTSVNFSPTYYFDKDEVHQDTGGQSKRHDDQEQEQKIGPDYLKPVSVDQQGDQERTAMDAKEEKTDDEYQKFTKYERCKDTEHVSQAKEEKIVTCGKDKKRNKGDDRCTENREKWKKPAKRRQAGLGGRRELTENQEVESRGPIRRHDQYKRLEDTQLDAKSRPDNVKEEEKTDTKQARKVLVRIYGEEERATSSGFQRTTVVKEKEIESRVKNPQSRMSPEGKNEKNAKNKDNPEREEKNLSVKMNELELIESAKKYNMKTGMRSRDEVNNSSSKRMRKKVDAAVQDTAMELTSEETGRKNSE
ncbi:hypothetical protein LDENG_00182870 [Lucifuga dentata]|nr:hypothetical protein LDENG_00182870 [Lucifuga dentata]